MFFVKPLWKYFFSHNSWTLKNLVRHFDHLIYLHIGLLVQKNWRLITQKPKFTFFLPEKCQISSAITVHLHDFNSRKSALLSPPSPSFSYYFWAKTTISRIWDKKNKVRKSWGAGHTHVWCNYDIKMKYKYTSTSR